MDRRCFRSSSVASIRISFPNFRVLAPQHRIGITELGQASESGRIERRIGRDVEIAKDLVEAIGGNRSKVSRLSDIRPDHFCQARAHPVDGGVARRIAEWQDRQRHCRSCAGAAGGVSLSRLRTAKPTAATSRSRPPAASDFLWRTQPAAAGVDACGVQRAAAPTSHVASECR